VEVVASLSQGRTTAAQCGLFTHKSVPVIFEPPCNISVMVLTDQNRKLGEKPYQGRLGPPQITDGLLGAFSMRKGD